MIIFWPEQDGEQEIMKSKYIPPEVEIIEFEGGNVGTINSSMIETPRV